MPVYHFNVLDGSEFRDRDGTELDDLRSARNEAVRLAGRLLMDKPDQFWKRSDWRVEVTDHVGLTLFRLNFTATDALILASGNPS